MSSNCNKNLLTRSIFSVRVFSSCKILQIWATTRRHVSSFFFLEISGTYFSKGNTVYYRLQRRRRVRVFASNVISLKGPLCNLKQSHVLHSRYFFENYFSPGTALLCVSLLYFRLTWTNSDSAGKVFYLLLCSHRFRYEYFSHFLACPVPAILTFLCKGKDVFTRTTFLIPADLSLRIQACS